jgi:outer membrane protein
VNIKRAKLNVESGSIQLKQTKLQLEQEVRKAYADAVKAESNMKANEKAIQASQAAFTWNELRFNEGVIGMSEYLDARNRLQQAELNYLRSKYDWLFKKKIVDFYLGKSIITQP